jgi:hypothetical protein
MSPVLVGRNLTISNDTLAFREGMIVSKFTKSKKSKGYDLDHCLKDNVDLLNQSFLARGHPTLEEIVKEKALNCDCNKWMGHVNLLSVYGEPKSWIMEIKTDSLIIKKITNVDRDPDDSVQTEKVASYKWE